MNPASLRHRYEERSHLPSAKRNRVLKRRSAFMLRLRANPGPPFLYFSLAAVFFPASLPHFLSNQHLESTLPIPFQSSFKTFSARRPAPALKRKLAKVALGKILCAFFLEKRVYSLT